MNVKIVENIEELNECLEVRRQVFVKEQNVPETLEIDEYDNLNNINVKHFIISFEGIVVGTLRIINNKDYLKIGRVAVLKSYREHNIGYNLVCDSMREIEEKNIFDIKNKYFYLESQVHAIKFYEKLGFEAYGEEFMDANIKHRKMIKR